MTPSVEVGTANPASYDIDFDEVAFNSTRRYLANCDFFRSVEECGAHQ